MILVGTIWDLSHCSLVWQLPSLMFLTGRMLKNPSILSGGHEEYQVNEGSLVPQRKKFRSNWKYKRWHSLILAAGSVLRVCTVWRGVILLCTLSSAHSVPQGANKSTLNISLVHKLHAVSEVRFHNKHTKKITYLMLESHSVCNIYRTEY